MEFSEELAVAQVTLIPLIIALVGVVKRLTRHVWEPHDDVWFALSLFLGVGIQLLYIWVFVGLPATGAEWFTTVVLGLAFGLAAGKTYDEGKARTGDN